MLSYHETLDIILNAATPRAPQKMALDHLTGLVAGETLTADALVPPFDNSAMDGFAVHSDQIAGATRTHPVVLTVDGSTMAGDRPATGQRGAWEIMTGAPVPKAYDAVIRIEDSVILEQDDAGRFCPRRSPARQGNAYRPAPDHGARGSGAGSGLGYPRPTRGGHQHRQGTG